MRRIALISALVISLTACQSMVMTGVQEGVMATAESRSFGTVIDDATIYTEINHYFIQTDVNDLLPNVNVVVRQGRVLLTGMVKRADTPTKAVNAAWKASGVKEVINEIEVRPEGSLVTRANDEWIEKMVEAKLTVTKGVNILNYSVEVMNSKVYLLGVVASDQELQNVFAVTRRIKGVKEVVSHLRLAEPEELLLPDGSYLVPRGPGSISYQKDGNDTYIDDHSENDHYDDGVDETLAY